MAFSNTTGLSLGDIIQIYYSNGIRLQISEDFRDWEYIKREKVSDVVARQIDFYIQSSLGPSAVQRRNPGSTNNFPRAQRVSSSEHSAEIKELSTTIELEYNVYKRAEESPNNRYAEPLKIEVDSKLLASKRQLSKELHGDGTGVICQLAASSATVSGGNLVFQLSTDDTARGNIGFCEFDEILVLKSNTGGTSALDTDLGTEPVYFIIVDRNRANDTVTMQGLDSSFAAVTITSISVQPTAGDVFYKHEQPTFPDLTSISDYGTASEVIPGLDSLTADDGRVVHGLTMSGATKGTRFDAQDTSLDTTHLESVMNECKVNVGESAYSWKMAIVSPEAYSQFINGRETDRRFNSVDDTVRGGKKWAYQHRNDTIELSSSEYCKKKRMYIMPEAKNGQGKVIEYHGTDFMPVKAPGESSEFRLKSGSNGYQNVMAMYMDSYGTLICKHPASVAVVHNFKID